MMIPSEALLGVIYSWYVSIRLRGLTEGQAVEAMAEAWNLAGTASKKKHGHIQRRSKEIIKLMNQALEDFKQKTADNELKDMSDFGKIITSDESIDWEDDDNTL